MTHLIRLPLLFLLGTLFPCISFASVYYADTDGNFSQDEITTTSEWVHIKDISSGAVNNYFIGGPYTLVDISDTNGVDGQEVLVATGSYLIVIDNRLRAKRSYTLGQFYTIHFVTDTNGEPGNEVVASIPNGLVRIINDAQKMKNDYNIESGIQPGVIVTTSDFRHADTDGVAGDEVVLWRNDNSVVVIHNNSKGLRTYKINSLFNISHISNTNGAAGSEIIINRNDNVIEVISDSNGTRHTYNIGYGYSIKDVKDTNGVSGDEIIVAQLVSPYDSRILIIDEAQGTKREYAINSNFNVEQITDIDGAHGVEVCYSKGTPLRYTIIIDRASRKVLSSSDDGCTVPRPPAPMNFTVTDVRKQYVFGWPLSIYIDTNWDVITGRSDIVGYVIDYCYGITKCTPTYRSKLLTAPPATLTLPYLYLLGVSLNVHSVDLNGYVSPPSNTLTVH